jgi:5'-nucleotidase
VRRDPANREYFWLTGRMSITDTDPDTDQIAVQQSCISVSPIHYDLTDRAMVDEMRSWGIEGLL